MMDGASRSSAQALPGFKAACTAIGLLYVLLGMSTALRGAPATMAQFGVPKAVLSSPHFEDFFHWVFVHMTTLGVLLLLLGRFVEPGRAQRMVARVMCFVELHYTYLDFRTSDSPLGNGLYRGQASLIPPIIDVLVLLTFAYLGSRPLAEYRETSTAASA